MILKSDGDHFLDKHDLRLRKAIDLFNSADWYQAHDHFEDLWHNSMIQERYILQAILQIAVAELHLEKGNINGASILFGESIGRLDRVKGFDFGIDLDKLRSCIYKRLTVLQQNESIEEADRPYIYFRN